MPDQDPMAVVAEIMAAQMSPENRAATLRILRAIAPEATAAGERQTH